MRSSNRGNRGGEEQSDSRQREMEMLEDRAPPASLLGPMSIAEQAMVLRQRQRILAEQEMVLRQRQQQQQFQYAAAQNQAAGGSSMSAQSNPSMRFPSDLGYLQEIRRAEEIVNMAQRAGMYNNNNEYAQRGTMYDRQQWAAARPMMNQQQDDVGLLNSMIMHQEGERPMKREGATLQDLQPPNKQQRMDPWMRMAGNMDAATQIALMQQQTLRQLGPQQQPDAPKERKRHVKSFPVKLMEAISANYNEAAFAWLPDGRSFVVVDPDLFCSEILSPAFKGGKYASFIRKLNRWKFTRLISGTGTDCFHHPLFQRDRPDLAALISCTGNSTQAMMSDPSLQIKPSLAGVEKYFRVSSKSETEIEIETSAATTKADTDSGGDDDDTDAGEKEEEGGTKEQEEGKAGTGENED